MTLNLERLSVALTTAPVATGATAVAIAKESVARVAAYEAIPPQVWITGLDTAVLHCLAHSRSLCPSYRFLDYTASTDRYLVRSHFEFNQGYSGDNVALSLLSSLRSDGAASQIFSVCLKSMR